VDGRTFRPHVARHYYAENQIVEALPVMIDKATDTGLKQGFQLHLLESKNQISGSSAT
jgi:ferritin-like metal-binding protein YciE